MKVLLYSAAVVILGATIAPYLYNLGKGLAEVTEHKQTNGVVAWAARLADRTSFAGFHNASLVLAATALSLPLFGWLRLGRPPGGHRDTPWSLNLPPHAVVTAPGQPLQKNPQGVWQFGTGLVLAAGMVLVSGWLLAKAGCFIWQDAPISSRGVPNPSPASPIGWGPILRASLAQALITAVFLEVLFRGMTLGIFLRAFRPVPAIAAVSLIFALAQFLIIPSSATVPDPEARNAGFVLLGKLFAGGIEPTLLLTRFPTALAMGVMLGVARYRTASLWLPVGLHAGWRFGAYIFDSTTCPTPGLPEAVRCLAGVHLLDGLLPLTVILATGCLVLPMTRANRDETL